MKTQKIKVKNIPTDTMISRTVRVKPVAAIWFFIIFGTALIVFRPILLVSGIMVVVASLFALLFMPDRCLCAFTPDYMILYDEEERDACYLVYWQEILNWRYIRKSGTDRLEIILEDGTCLSQDMYSRYSIARFMDTYAPGKEVRVSRNAK